MLLSYLLEMAPTNPILYKYLLMKRIVSGIKNLDLIFIEFQFLKIKSLEYKEHINNLIIYIIKFFKNYFSLKVS